MGVVLGILKGMVLIFSMDKVVVFMAGFLVRFLNWVLLEHCMELIEFWILEVESSEDCFGFSSGSLNLLTNVFFIWMLRENGVSDTTKLRFDNFTCFKIWSQISWIAVTTIVIIYINLS